MITGYLSLWCTNNFQDEVTTCYLSLWCTHNFQDKVTHVTFHSDVQVCRGGLKFPCNPSDTESETRCLRQLCSKRHPWPALTMQSWCRQWQMMQDGVSNEDDNDLVMLVVMMFFFFFLLFFYWWWCCWLWCSWIIHIVKIMLLRYIFVYNRLVTRFALLLF